MTREEAVQSIKLEYDQLRIKHEYELRTREKEAVEKDPEIGNLLALRAALPVRSLKCAMADRGHAQEIAQQMKEEGLRLNRDIRARLSKLGLSEDYLSLHYECPICRDTGYVSDITPAKTCDCYEKKIRKLLRESDGFAAFDTQCFEAFDENRIPEVPVMEGVTQRAYTVRLRELCETYADTYPNPFKPHLMLGGEAGLGKTFLLNCIADRIEKRGYPATMVTAYRLLEIMRDRHFHIEEGEGEFENLLTCPLLLIDDLGCEPMLRNITQEYLFILFNERLVKGRNTVVATNMTFPQIKERYGERLMSRLADQAVWDHIRLLGKDLRRV